MIYEIAELRIKINNKYSFTDRFCFDYLSNNQESDVDLEIEVSKSEFEKERGLILGFSDGYVENICIYRKICQELPKWNKFLMHCSVVEYNGNCYAFLGKSGTGKSTHSLLWLKNLETAKILNGDKPIIAFENGEFIVYGTPWMGKEKLGYKGKGRLKSLCFLKQAKINEITKLEKQKVVPLLFNQLLITKDEEMVAKTMELADLLIKSIPSYLLKCDMSQGAFDLSYKTLICGDENE